MANNLFIGNVKSEFIPAFYELAKIAKAEFRTDNKSLKPQKTTKKTKQAEFYTLETSPTMQKFRAEFNALSKAEQNKMRAELKQAIKETASGN